MLLILLAVGPPPIPSAVSVGDDKPPPGSAKKDGLSLTARLDKKTYKRGEDITLSFTLENESDKEMYVGDGWLAPTQHEVGSRRHFDVHLVDENQAILQFWSRALTEGFAVGARRVFRLKPGGSYTGLIFIVASGKHEMRTEVPKRGGGVYTFVEKSESGSVYNVTTDQRHELGKDGHTYSLTLIYQVDPRTYHVYQPPIEFVEELLWKGKMETTPLEFSIEQPTTAIP